MDRKQFIHDSVKLSSYAQMMVNSLNNYHTDSLDLNGYDKANIQAFLKPCEGILITLMSILEDKTIDKRAKP